MQKSLLDSIGYGFFDINLSADGSKLILTDSSGNVYTSSAFNPDLKIDILTPTATSTISHWNPYVSFGTAVSCAYSYNNIDWNNLNCENSGGDIPRPALTGTSTLYARGTDINGITINATSTFSYLPYYWCGTADSNWSTLGNWYMDNLCSIPSGALPDAAVDVYTNSSTSPVINTNTWLLAKRIDATGLVGSAGISGIIFTGTSTNNVYVIGNATFNDSAHNTGVVTGNATFNTSYFTSAVDGTITIPSGSSWAGTVSGDTYGSDGSLITNYIFNGTSFNDAVFNGSAIFNNSASNLGTITGSSIFNSASNNNGTINGSATFNNTSPFTIGTVNGTVTLNGFSQVLSGVNNVTNFVKQLAGGVRDTLYLLSGSTLNISGLTTLFGSDAGNLLTIRATSPNSLAHYAKSTPSPD